ncbi:MAG: shikimate dehydrogenase family protein [Acidimicrobiales bacterium]
MNWRLAVVGSPIEHSLSPVLHEAGLALAGLQGTSTRVELSLDQGGELRELMGATFDAVSVTMPLKEVAAGVCADLDDVAARIGVVNSLLVRDGQLLGACTDGRGFIDALGGELSYSVAGKHVVVLGAGGAARGIVDALVESSAQSVVVQGRTLARVHEIVDRYESVRTSMPAGTPVDLVINTLPIGGRLEPSLLDGVHELTVAIDITYEPRMSKWRELYESRGCRSANGLGMLAYQAARQMQWWFQMPIDGAKLMEVFE